MVGSGPREESGDGAAMDEGGQTTLAGGGRGEHRAGGTVGTPVRVEGRRAEGRPPVLVGPQAARRPTHMS